MIYYIRAIKQDWPTVESLTEALGVATRNPETGELVGQGWVFIGPVMKPTGQFVEVATDPELSVDESGNATLITTQTIELTAPVCDANGNEYVHANLVYDGSLRELAESKAAEHPELAAALAEVPRYFVTDTEGNPVVPQNPARVIF